MNDEQLLRDLGSWLKDTDADHPDTERITARAMTEVPRVRQRGRWWPLPDLGGLGGRRSRKQRPTGSTLPTGSQPLPALPTGSQPLPASGPTLFSALRFVAAGVMVGLFGGFLLAGVLTTQQPDKVPAAVTEPPSPMTTDSLLSRATTEEVEPGILRVIDDGVRDLPSAGNTSLVSGRDGAIWLLSQDGFVRLGADATDDWPSGQAESASDFGVAPDGTVWTVLAEGDASTIWSFNDGGWMSHGQTSDRHTLEVTSDGKVWALWQDPGSDASALGYLTADGWQSVGDGLGGELHDGRLYVSDGGDVWVAGGPKGLEHLPRLFGLVDGAWQRRFDGNVTVAGVGPEGTVWFVSGNELLRLEGIADGTDPEAWRLSDLWMTERESASHADFLPGDAFRVAPDGSVWFALHAKSGPPLMEESCEGIARFDGTNRVGPSLSHLCVTSIEVAADGSVWLLAHDREADDDLAGLYVITPEGAATRQS